MDAETKSIERQILEIRLRLLLSRCEGNIVRKLEAARLLCKLARLA